MVLRYEHFVQQNRDTWDVMKCGAGEGRGRSVGRLVSEMKKYYKVKEERNILHTIKGRLTGLVTSSVEPAL